MVHINKIRLDRFESVFIQYTIYRRLNIPKAALLTPMNTQYNTIQSICFSLISSPAGTHPSILDVRQCSAKVSKAVNKGNVPQLLIAQRQQDFQRKMRHPSVQNIHRSSTRHYYISQKFKVRRITFPLLV
jgi:hypothetical protein